MIHFQFHPPFPHELSVSIFEHSMSRRLPLWGFLVKLSLRFYKNGLFTLFWPSTKKWLERTIFEMQKKQIPDKVLVLVWTKSKILWISQLSIACMFKIIHEKVFPEVETTLMKTFTGRFFLWSGFFSLIRISPLSDIWFLIFVISLISDFWFLWFQFFLISDFSDQDFSDFSYFFDQDFNCNVQHWS